MPARASEALAFESPPRSASTNFEGDPRHVGVEIEFAAVTAREAAERVCDLFGGQFVALDKHRYDVRGGELGDFRCELDFRFAHPPGSSREAADEDSFSALFAEFRQSMHALLGDVGALIVPCEVVCPPLALGDLPRLEELREALRRSGAEGTGSGLVYAFGAQLNPDIASRDAAYLARMLKAYLLLSDWLRSQIHMDITRSLLAYAEPFPQDYAELVLQPDYWPETAELIDHYLAYNPTRNRELDMLPLFDWLDSSRVRAAVADPLIKPRPAFHYRLPDARIHEPDWTLACEWNRWCRVERLAADGDRLEQAALGWFRNRESLSAPSWAQEVQRYLDAP